MQIAYDARLLVPDLSTNMPHAQVPCTVDEAHCLVLRAQT